MGVQSRNLLSRPSTLTTLKEGDGSATYCDYLGSGKNSLSALGSGPDTFLYSKSSDFWTDTITNFKQVPFGTSVPEADKLSFSGGFTL
jgi:hypothetical protein